MKKGKIFGLVIHIFAILLTLGFLIVGIFDKDNDWGLWIALGALIHFVCSSIFHELGHLIVIKKRKCKVVGWNILGFYNDKTTNSCGYSAVNYAGSISFVSTDPEKAKEDLQKVSLGGVVANAIYMTVCIAIGVIAWDVLISTLILLCGSYVSLYMVIINLLPLRGDGDGSVYFGIKRNKAEYQPMINLAKILSCLYNGYSPKEIPIEYYDNVSGYMSEGVLYYKMLYHIQIGELRKAYDIALDLQEEFEDAILPERLYVAIRLNYSLEIPQLAESISYLEPESAKYFRINGAYRKYCNDEEWAKLCKQSGVKAIEDEYFKGLAKLEEELINLI